MYDLREPCVSPPMCYNMTLEIMYMNDPHVQMAFGLPKQMAWQPCSDDVSKDFVNSGDFFWNLMPQVTQLLDAGVGVLVYNGDDDYMVDWIGSKTWMAELLWPFRNQWLTTPEESFKLHGRNRG